MLRLLCDGPTHFGQLGPHDCFGDPAVVAINLGAVIADVGGDTESAPTA
jgi:hypothetical protein